MYLCSTVVYEPLTIPEPSSRGSQGPLISMYVGVPGAVGFQAYDLGS